MLSPLKTNTVKRVIPTKVAELIGASFDKCGKLYIYFSGQNNTVLEYKNAQKVNIFKDDHIRVFFF